MDLNKLLNFSALAGIVGAVSACIADVLAIIPMWTTGWRGHVRGERRVLCVSSAHTVHSALHDLYFNTD